MVILLTIIHVLLCLFLIGVILLQQGKSADLASAFGGQGSQTAFGPRGASNVLSKSTTWCAIAFMFTSIGLFALMQRNSGVGHSVLSGTKTTQTTPATPARK
ncbi:preprotein translocase subunit SecG [Acidipila sp. EB88]|uniref:preprotein translocase subunit SecG n=1 Tax=Acidipila sp. EB88 TaxID=2305226 RepID=UPI000F5D844E|nr:preprotein translocase subunit SecG [Acidipila sp. EB88]RRA49500.1 preprotein translocase subunit SecG [Acidipila sp. EB88]